MWSLETVQHLKTIVYTTTLLVALSYFKACVCYFYQIFIFSPNDSTSKTIKNVFYFIEKALVILEIFRFL